MLLKSIKMLSCPKRTLNSKRKVLIKKTGFLPILMWDWSGNLEQLVVKKKLRTKRRGKPAKLKDEKSRKNSRDDRRRRKIRRIW